MKNSNLLFYGSVFLGIFIWILFFIITPIQVKSTISNFTLTFVSLSYLALILGYFSAPKILKNRFINKQFPPNLKTEKYNILRILIILILISFAFRYFDLFINREVKFTNPTYINKYNASSPENFSLLFALLSFFRVLFFVPLIFYYVNKTNKKIVFSVCLLLFFLPFIEAYLRGSRRIIFESLGLLSIILFIFNKVNFKSLKTIIILTITFIVLFGFSLSVLKSRISQNTNEFYAKIFNSQYNELVPPKENAIKFIQENNNNLIGQIYFSEIHIGQYIVHGIYEMDYMVSTNPNHTFGRFNFYSFIKFFNKLKLSNIPLSSLNNPTKRITYITFFGGMFLDFGWFSLIILFLFGVFQNKILLYSKGNYLLIPLAVLFVFSNTFLLIFNFLRTQFIFTITIYLVFTIIVLLVFKNKSLYINHRN